MNSPNQPGERRCKQCGASLLSNDVGVCLRCALENAVQPVSYTQARSFPAADLTSQQAAQQQEFSRSFGDYELLEEIARGGMGVVYRARQVSLDRIVAVKMILFGPLASAEQVRRFRTEASAAGCLQHPNIVAIHEVGLHENQHYLAMDFVDGPNLERLVHEGPLSAKRAVGYLKVIAEAVHYAHERGILHRDLKPSNVLIDSDDRPRVVDFGLAKRFTGDSSLTLSGQVLGSPSYMPPEQAGAAQVKVGRYSDVYSLGAILYHLLTGRPPFQAETVAQTLSLVTATEPLAPRMLNPGVPRDLETICLKCLEKEPRQRYATAQELADELSRVLGKKPIQARPVSTLERTWRWCRREPFLATSLAGLVAALVAGCLGITWQWLKAEHNYSLLAIALAENEIETEAVGSQSRLRIDGEATVFFYSGGDGERSYRVWRSSSGLREARETGRGTQTSLRVYEVRGNQRSSPELKHGSFITSADFGPDDRWIVSGDAEGMARVWDVQTGRLQISPIRHKQPVNAVRFSPDGHRVATGSSENTACIWDAHTGRLVLGPLTADRSPVIALRFTQDGRHLAGLTAQNTVAVWDASTGKLRSTRIRKVSPTNEGVKTKHGTAGVRD